LRNDKELFVGYRRRLVEHGVFELPLNLKRSHCSYAHTEADIDALLEATESAVLGARHALLAQRGAQIDPDMMYKSWIAGGGR
jgi:glutamate-1-semialdehyde aminotransferase